MDDMENEGQRVENFTKTWYDVSSKFGFNIIVRRSRSKQTSQSSIFQIGERERERSQPRVKKNEMKL